VLFSYRILVDWFNFVFFDFGVFELMCCWLVVLQQQEEADNIPMKEPHNPTIRQPNNRQTK